MPTNVNDATTGTLTQAVSGIADSVASSDPAGAAGSGTAIAEDFVKMFASGLDQLFRSVFQSFCGFDQIFQGSWDQQPTGNDASEKAALDANALNSEIVQLRHRIDSMKAEAQRLLASADTTDQSRGQT